MSRPHHAPIDPDRMTLADLRRALDRKESELRELLARRDDLAHDLEQLGETLQAMLAGSDISASERAAKSPRAAARRADADETDEIREKPKSRKSRAGSIVREGSLQMAIRSVLERVIGPLRVAEIVDAVLKAGYATKSANLNVIVSNRLAQMDDVEKVERGLYQLARPSSAPSSAAPPDDTPPMVKAATA
jgi:phage terminase small subunit